MIIVSLHTPLNSETKGLIGKEELAKMKPSAILINTSRGPVVDSDALADALNNGRLAGAGIDVFEAEPPIAKDHPLLTAKNGHRHSPMWPSPQRRLWKNVPLSFLTMWTSG